MAQDNDTKTPRQIGDFLRGLVDQARESSRRRVQQSAAQAPQTSQQAQPSQPTQPALDARSLHPPLPQASQAPQPTQAQRGLLDAGEQIATNPPTGDEMAFTHAVLCQVGLPRSRVAGEHFIRQSGTAWVHVQSGYLDEGKGPVPQPVPYGALPRLALAWVSSYALRHKQRDIPIGDSAAEFLRLMGMDDQGARYMTLRRQMHALAACRLQLGFKGRTYNGQPIQRFDAWLTNQGANQRALWPGVLLLGADYFGSLIEERRTAGQPRSDDPERLCTGPGRVRLAGPHRLAPHRGQWRAAALGDAAGAVRSGIHRQGRGQELQERVFANAQECAGGLSAGPGETRPRRRPAAWFTTTNCPKEFWLFGQTPLNRTTLVHEKDMWAFFCCAQKPGYPSTLRSCGTGLRPLPSHPCPKSGAVHNPCG